MNTSAQFDDWVVLARRAGLPAETFDRPMNWTIYKGLRFLICASATSPRRDGGKIPAFRGFYLEDMPFRSLVEFRSRPALGKFSDRLPQNVFHPLQYK